MEQNQNDFELSAGIAQSFSVPADDSNQLMRVLVADDSAAIRKLLRHGLASDEYQIIEASNGEEALTMATRRPEPHAILIDARMSRIDGLEVCRRLKSDMQYRTIPVVIMTTSGSNEDIAEAVEAGADEFLSKPVNRSELAVRIRSITRMHRGNAEMIGAESVALSLARAVASKDGYSSGHVEQVANIAVAFGKTLGMDSAELKMLRFGAILHNVGKIAIPDSILETTGPLTPRERALFHQHPRVGCDICAPLSPLRPVLPIIRHHKEHYDGTGYPDGLRGDEIPLKAQVVGIVDVYSALTNDRPFRRAKTHDEAIEMLRDRARHGMHDPKLVEKFCEAINAPSGLGTPLLPEQEVDAAAAAASPENTAAAPSPENTSPAASDLASSM